MPEELVPHEDSDDIRKSAHEVPVDITVHRPEKIAVVGNIALTKTTIFLTPRGQVDREADGPDARTVDGAITVVGPTTFLLNAEHSESLRETLLIDDGNKELEG